MAEHTWVFVVHDIPPGPNERLHWRVRHGRTAPLRDAVAYQALAALPARHVPLRRAAVTITLYRQARHRAMDPDNAVACTKVLIDGLVVGKLLADDRDITLTVAQETGDTRRAVIEVRA